MGTPASALGAVASGAGSVGSLLSGVSSLLPTTTTQSGSYQNTAKATSDTVGLQGNISATTTKEEGTSTTRSNSANTSVQDILNKILSNSTSSQVGSETNVGKATQTAATSNIENFSGQQNQSVQQTLLTDPAVMRIVNLMFQGDGGVPGLQAVASGERNAGVFNSSTNQMMLNNLIATVGGEVARLSAPVVTNQNVGATSTAQSGQSSVVSDTINKIVSQLSANTEQSQSGTTKGTTTDTATGSQQSENSTTQEALSQLISLALQSVDQSSESEGTSKTKTKSKKFPSAVGFIVFGLMGATMEHPVYAANQAFAKNEFSTKDLLEYYRFSKRLETKLRECPVEEIIPTLQTLNSSYVTPVAAAYIAKDVTKAKELYSKMLTVI